MSALAEHCASQDRKCGVPAYLASVFFWQEAEALNVVRFWEKVAICWYLAQPGEGAAAASTYKFAWAHWSLSCGDGRGLLGAPGRCHPL